MHRCMKCRVSISRRRNDERKKKNKRKFAIFKTWVWYHLETGTGTFGTGLRETFSGSIADCTSYIFFSIDYRSSDKSDGSGRASDADLFDCGC